MRLRYTNRGAKERQQLSFKELLAKYEKEEAIQRQKERLDKGKDTKSKLTSSEQSDPHLHQGNYVVMPDSGLIAPWFWSYPFLLYTFGL